jgi:hypothetical protein
LFSARGLSGASSIARALEAARLGEIGPGVAVERIGFERAFQQLDLLGQVASRERERAGEVGAQLRQLWIQGECMTIWREGVAVPIRQLQRVAEAEAGDGFIGPQLRNNGGECDGVLMPALLKQTAGDALGRVVVDGLQERRGFEPDSARSGLVILLRQRGTLQESQERGPHRVARVGNHMRHESVQAVARFFVKRSMVPSNPNAVCRTTPNR